ncbi:MAG: SPOR domain-containing protein, partial [Bacteroidota bacterium]
FASFLLIFSGWLLFPASLSAQSNKSEVKFWKDKAKGYTKNPLALKSEFENYQNQIKDLKRRNKSLVNQQTQGLASPEQSDLVDSLRWAIIQLEGKLQSTTNQYMKMEAAYKTQNKVSEMGIRTGLVYGIQVGAFIFHEMENAPADQEDFIVERADGYNKYVIGNFRTYEEASGFRDELRKIGISDAWIVPYIDGVRATMEEAENYLRQQGR